MAITTIQSETPKPRLNRGLSNQPPDIFRIKERLYAMASGNVREIVILPHVTFVPTMAPKTRGVINLQGGVISVLARDYDLHSIR